MTTLANLRKLFNAVFAEPRPTESFEERLERTYRYILDYYKANGMPPALRDLVDVGLVSSTSVAHNRLKALEKRGLVRSVRRRTGTTYYIPVLRAGNECPLCGAPYSPERGPDG